MAKIHSTSFFGNNSTKPDAANSETYKSKLKRVRNELKAAGMTSYGLNKFNARYLPKIILDNEHIQSVIYGRYTEGAGFLNFVDRMVVATDERVISINHKPGYTDIDEFTYDIIDGVEESTAGPFAAVTLNTKVSHFTIRFVNKKCAQNFVNFVEGRRVDYYLKRVAG
ncbi:MAG: PH domain-containing protein [Candidatus Saccharimonadales bacterium]